VLCQVQDGKEPVVPDIVLHISTKAKTQVLRQPKAQTIIVSDNHSEPDPGVKPIIKVIRDTKTWSRAARMEAKRR